MTLNFNPHKNDDALSEELQKRIRFAHTVMSDIEDYIKSEIYTEWDIQQLRAENEQLRKALTEVSKVVKGSGSAAEWIANADIAQEPGWAGSREYILDKLRITGNTVCTALEGGKHDTE